MKRTFVDFLKNAFSKEATILGKMMSKKKEVTNWAKAWKHKTPIGTKMRHKNPQKNLLL